jgi:ribosomal protein L17
MKKNNSVLFLELVFFLSTTASATTGDLPKKGSGATDASQPLSEKEKEFADRRNQASPVTIEKLNRGATPFQEHKKLEIQSQDAAAIASGLAAGFLVNEHIEKIERAKAEKNFLREYIKKGDKGNLSYSKKLLTEERKESLIRKMNTELWQLFKARKNELEKLVPENKKSLLEQIQSIEKNLKDLESDTDKINIRKKISDLQKEIQEMGEDAPKIPELDDFLNKANELLNNQDEKSSQVLKTQIEGVGDRLENDLGELQKINKDSVQAELQKKIENNLSPINFQKEHRNTELWQLFENNKKELEKLVPENKKSLLEQIQSIEKNLKDLESDTDKINIRKKISDLQKEIQEMGEDAPKIPELDDFLNKANELLNNQDEKSSQVLKTQIEGVGDRLENELGELRKINRDNVQAELQKKIENNLSPINFQKESIQKTLKQLKTEKKILDTIIQIEKNQPMAPNISEGPEIKIEELENFLNEFLLKLKVNSMINNNVKEKEIYNKFKDKMGLETTTEKIKLKGDKSASNAEILGKFAQVVLDDKKINFLIII